MKALALQTYAGYRLYPVERVSETAKRTRVRVLTDVPLPGRRAAKRGAVVSVPTHALREVNIVEWWRLRGVEPVTAIP